VIPSTTDRAALLGTSDRVLVLRRGRLRGEFIRAEATSEKLLRAASDA
jgi:ABC-type sugar transport system ATPase subunit